jgi:LysM repeat protein
MARLKHPVFRAIVRCLAHGALLCSVVVATAACTLPLPDPPAVDLPTQPAVLDITPAPTLDIDATATVMAGELRPTPTPAGIYVVQAGDTLSSLAGRFNTTVEEILIANDLTDPNTLQAGQELIIPSLLPTPLISTPAPTLSPSPGAAPEPTAVLTATTTLTTTATMTTTLEQ